LLPKQWRRFRLPAAVAPRGCVTALAPQGSSAELHVGPNCEEGGGGGAVEQKTPELCFEAVSSGASTFIHCPHLSIVRVCHRERGILPSTLLY
jgi:hypothetical protein